MYIYKNRKTGQVVQTTCRVTGINWELLETKQQNQEEKPKKPRAKKSRKIGEGKT